MLLAVRFNSLTEVGIGHALPRDDLKYLKEKYLKRRGGLTVELVVFAMGMCSIIFVVYCWHCLL